MLVAGVGVLRWLHGQSHASWQQEPQQSQNTLRHPGPLALLSAHFPLRFALIPFTDPMSLSSSSLAGPSSACLVQRCFANA